MNFVNNQHAFFPAHYILSLPTTTQKHLIFSLISKKWDIHKKEKNM